MQILDLAGSTSVTTVAELNERLRSVRRGEFGTFILRHDDDGPSLWIHINGPIAYLHYFPDAEGRHAGYQPTGMTPESCPPFVRITLVNGTPGDDVEMPASTLVSLDVGSGIRDLKRLRRAYGSGRWRKLKGFATIRLSDGTICQAEVHWYEAHGIGKKELKIKRLL